MATEMEMVPGLAGAPEGLVVNILQYVKPTVSLH